MWKIRKVGISFFAVSPGLPVGLLATRSPSPPVRTAILHHTIHTLTLTQTLILTLSLTTNPTLTLNLTLISSYKHQYPQPYMSANSMTSNDVKATRPINKTIVWLVDRE